MFETVLRFWASDYLAAGLGLLRRWLWLGILAQRTDSAEGKLKKIGFSFFLWLTIAVSATAECRETRASFRGDWGQANFSIELADSPEERSKGLMHRKTLPQSSGMLFIFEQPQPVWFWMKNTLIPLDIIFMDQSGTVNKVHEMAQPHDLTQIYGGDDIQYVFEINGGLAAALGIAAGSQLRHPAIDQEIGAWPC